MDPEILYEDNHLLVVNKRTGQLVHGDKTGDVPLEESLKDYLRVKYDKKGNIFLKATHRLDRPVGGALILGKTSKGHERMMRLFREREIHKTYWALTVRMPNPESGRVLHYLLKDSERNIVRWSQESREGAKEAVTDYTVLSYLEPHYLIELRPITGRSHQLRVMLRSKRCPIVGDVKYNGRRIEDPGAIMLHARKIRFIHPVKLEEIEIVAPLPHAEHWQKFDDDNVQ